MHAMIVPINLIYEFVHPRRRRLVFGRSHLESDQIKKIQLILLILSKNKI